MIRGPADPPLSGTVMLLPRPQPVPKGERSSLGCVLVSLLKPLQGLARVKQQAGD